MSGRLAGGQPLVRLVALYLQSRRAPRVLLGILGSAGLAGLLLALTSDQELVQLTQVVMPLVPATLLGVSIWTPFGDAERGASRPLVTLRLIHLGGLLACAAIALDLANRAAPDPDSRGILGRNLVGYTGLAFIGGRVVDPAFASVCAWALPLAYAAVVWGVDERTTWAWAKQPVTRESATAVAIALLAVGLALTLPAGRRPGASEGDVA